VEKMPAKSKRSKAHKRHPTGLDASLIPHGGKNVPKMRNTSYISIDGVQTQQTMQTLEGKAKGIQTILTERGLWKRNMNLQCNGCKNKVNHNDRKEIYSLDDDSLFLTNQCCGRYCLSQQPDFLAQREWLREIVEDEGFEIVFYPKYHCELNYIEMVWAYMKSHLRKNCTYNFNDLHTKLPDVLENQISIAFIRRAARHCYRFMSGYRMGLEGPLLDYACKKYTSHRRIPDNVIQELMKKICRSKGKENYRRGINNKYSITTKCSVF
jgi:hypothetical protein